MANDEDNQSLPDGIKEARRQSVEWIYRYERLHQVSDDPEKLERGRAMLHTHVMLYWNEMKRFARHPRIYDLWHEDPLTKDGMVLEDLRNLRFAEETEMQTVHDPETNAEEEDEVIEPWRLHPRQALAVHDRLDDCLHKLGVDQQWINETRERYKSSKSNDADPISDDIKTPQ